MQTIHIDVKDSYVSNVLTLLKGVKDVMIEKIHVDSPKEDSNNDFMDLQMMSMQEHSMKSTWDNDADKAWDGL